MEMSMCGAIVNLTVGLFLGVSVTVYYNEVSE